MSFTPHPTLAPPPPSHSSFSLFPPNELCMEGQARGCDGGGWQGREKERWWAPVFCAFFLKERETPVILSCLSRWQHWLSGEVMLRLGRIFFRWLLNICSHCLHPVCVKTEQVREREREKGTHTKKKIAKIKKEQNWLNLLTGRTLGRLGRTVAVASPSLPLPLSTSLPLFLFLSSEALLC